MAFLPGVTVRGGASKLFTHVKRLALEDGFEGVMSYADLRFGNGGVYSKCGMEEMEESKLNYWYTDGHSRFDRFVFRARPGKSEEDVSREEGVMRVWGAGNKIFVWKMLPNSIYTSVHLYEHYVMKITIAQLRRIISEEVSRARRTSGGSQMWLASYRTKSSVYRGFGSKVLLGIVKADTPEDAHAAASAKFGDVYDDNEGTVEITSREIVTRLKNKGLL